MKVTSRNHYVPQLYLKHFASPSGQIYLYRFLVSHVDVPIWKRASLGAVAYYVNLYTHSALGTETDEMETWLGKEFESPAESVIQKVIADRRLTKEDWRVLIRFAAAQMVRTPAFLLANLPQWNQMMPAVLAQTTANVRREIDNAKSSGEVAQTRGFPKPQYFPVRVTREDDPAKGIAKITTEVAVGRSLWLYSMRHLLTNSLEVLHEHRWSILVAPRGISWPTTDDPVVRLNFRSATDYDFEGGWARPKANILLPLSPRHLLFTQIGERAQEWGTVVSEGWAQMIRKILVEHAFRYVFSPVEDANIPLLRPRVVNADAYQNEKEQWRSWHIEQAKVERSLT
jgi:hypothetical protein